MSSSASRSATVTGLLSAFHSTSKVVVEVGAGQVAGLPGGLDGQVVPGSPVGVHAGIASAAGTWLFGWSAAAGFDCSLALA